MDVRLDLISWSFGAGVFAFFNPCGFAMLPAYVAHYIGGDGRVGQGAVTPLLKGLSLGGVVSAGFFTVFVALGIVISLIGHVLGEILPWMGAAIGVGLILLGAHMLLGNAPIPIPGLGRLADIFSPTGANPVSSRRDLSFYYGYGVTYALASTGCTFPIFMIVVGNAFVAGGVFNGSVQFGVYAAGMAAMMLALSIVMVFSKKIVQRTLPRMRPVIHWIGGLGVVVAGGYLIYYNLFLTGLMTLGL